MIIQQVEIAQQQCKEHIRQLNEELEKKESLLEECDGKNFQWLFLVQLYSFREIAIYVSLSKRLFCFFLFHSPFQLRTGT